MEQTLLFTDDPLLLNRPVTRMETDIKALYAIVQAAVDVELFTIPLYMTSLYSLQGMHEINSEGNNYYEGRMWPGMSPTANPKTGNDKAFNAVFSVFVAEMLHLQIISNMAKVVGYDPVFTSGALQDKNYGWTSYSENETVLPHILDLRDTVSPYNQIKVKLGPMNEEQLQLFLAIEQTDKAAKSIIDPDKIGKYSAVAPFDDWKEGDNLPYFGSIGNMYLQLWKYLSLKYDDEQGTTLWQAVFERGLEKAKADAAKAGDPETITMALQREVFNPGPKDKDEYPFLPTSINTNESEKALNEVLNMINGITDQGEGGGVIEEIKRRTIKKPMLQAQMNLKAVADQFRPSCPVLRNKYPSYSATGEKLPNSAKAEARHHFGALDHFETFGYVLDLLRDGELVTWDQWHALGNKWTPDMLQTAAYDRDRYPKLPASYEIAAALNRLKLGDTPDEANFKLFSRTAAGAIAGVTRVLNNYFKSKKKPFPFPSMGGSGDRVSICWAVFGKLPDLSLGIAAPDAAPIDRNQHIYHACQGLNLDESIKSDQANCAQVEIFHTCKGSNECKGEGGCGFVQSTKGGGGCGGSASNTFKKVPKADSKDQTYSPPSDNACGALGGCAVPISASQMYPALSEEDVYRMQLHNFGEAPGYQPEELQTMYYDKGELVYDVAWKAYRKVLEARGTPVPAKPEPSDLRLAFPPST